MTTSPAQLRISQTGTFTLEQVANKLPTTFDCGTMGRYAIDPGGGREGGAGGGGEGGERGGRTGLAMPGILTNERTTCDSIYLD